MAVRQIVPGLHQISLGLVNAFLVASRDARDLTLIDTGYPGSADTILRAVHSLGRDPRAIRHILVTHNHPDHAGSLAALKQATGAPAYMHHADAGPVRKGRIVMRLKPVSGLLPAALFRLFVPRGPVSIPAAEIEHEVADREELPAAGGIRVVWTPGHSPGHLVFLWRRHGGVVFAADAASNVMGLGLSLGYEDLAEGKRSLTKIAGLDFEVAVFGHGRAITSGASARFRRKWDAVRRWA
jgi:glyoxylase-like metal-dependent hydrolase (beta-lactamase superfamily II)